MSFSAGSATEPAETTEIKITVMIPWDMRVAIRSTSSM